MWKLSLSHTRTREKKSSFILFSYVSYYLRCKEYLSYHHKDIIPEQKNGSFYQEMRREILSLDYSENIKTVEIKT